MPTINLKPFQEEAIADLRKQFLVLWATGKRQLPLIFKAPTGSGKTVMVAQFLRDLTGDPQFDADKSFLWFSFSEDSYTQSKNKLFNYYGGAGEINLLDLNDLNRGKLGENNLFFINWQKLKDSTKEGRKLRRENEFTSEDMGIFDSFIKKTHEDSREIILIIDEAHRDTDTELADELIKLIDPRIILKITATPKTEPSVSDVNHRRAGFVEVEREDVIEAGLIKEKIVTQTKEDLDRVAEKEIDQDNLLLELAFFKKSVLKECYKDLNLEINPLVLIQLPNDDQARKETLDKSKLEIVKDYLKNKGISNHEIAVWLSEEKENLEYIEENNSDVAYLIFKQAAATGWDCPRASILVMFREIKNPTFHTQTVGRILRMPEAKHYPKPELNAGYLYTNYERNQIQLPDDKIGKNKPFIYESQRKKLIKPIILESTFMGRTDYNDLGDSFQNTFKEVADSYFAINAKDKMEAIKTKLRSKNLEIDNFLIENQLIIDAEIENYDNFVQEIKDGGYDFSQETPNSDIQRMYNLLCFNIIAKQEEENKKFAPERSWGKLKTALNIWFSERIDCKRENYYRIIVKDLLKPDSVLRAIVSQALEKYRPIRQQESKKKEARIKRIEELEVPRLSLFYTDDYEPLKKLEKTALKRNSMDPFFLRKSYPGKINEQKFIQYLEAKDKVEWWYKNGDIGSEHFSIPYYNKDKKREDLFYPDWIVKLKGKKILILDTKQGLTAKDQETKCKAEALQKWIKAANKKNPIFIGGITVNVSELWKLNNKEIYIYDSNFSDWILLDSIFK